MDTPVLLPQLDPDAEVLRSARAQERFSRTIGDFPRLMRGTFRRHDPKDADRTPLVRAARLAGAHLGLKLAELEEGEGEAPEAFLERFAIASGARPRSVSLQAMDALEGEGPIVAFARGDNRPLVLLPGRLRGMRLIDPVTDRRISMGELAQDRRGYALHATLPATKLTYRMLLSFGLGSTVPLLLTVIACGLGESLLGLVSPVAFGLVASKIIPTDNILLLLEVSAAVLVAALLQTALHLTARLGRAQIEGKAGLALHAAMVDRVLRVPTAVLRQSSTAILATQTETVDKFRRSVIDCGITFTMAMLNGVAAAILMCVYSPVAGLVGIASVLLLLAVTVLFGRLQFKAIYEGERMDVVVLTFVYDLIRLVPVLQAQRAERPAFVQWAQNFLAFQSRIMRSTRMGNSLQAFEAGWEVMTLGVTFAAIAWLGAAGGLATGAAMAFVISLGKLNAAGVQASHALSGIAKLMPMAKLARSLIEQTVLPAVSGAAVPALKGAISFVDVSFGYEARPVLTAVNFEVAAGEFVGIYGPSGGGKTSLLRLLLGLDPPRSGRVLIDGLDVSELDRASLASQLGFVMQNGQLWAGSIAENIRGGSGISLEDATVLAARLGLDVDLAAMPMGMQTILGAGGLGLSRGQIQKILIARALAINPRILVLDEPAGALQGAAQLQLLRTLNALDMTRVVVSHDPRLLAGATRLFELQDGRLAPSPMDARSLRKAPWTA